MGAPLDPRPDSRRLRSLRGLLGLGGGKLEARGGSTQRRAQHQQRGDQRGTYHAHSQGNGESPRASIDNTGTLGGFLQPPAMRSVEQSSPALARSTGAGRRDGRQSVSE